MDTYQATKKAIKAARHAKKCTGTTKQRQKMEELAIRAKLEANRTEKKLQKRYRADKPTGRQCRKGSTVKNSKRCITSYQLRQEEFLESGLFS